MLYVVGPQHHVYKYCKIHTLHCMWMISKIYVISPYTHLSILTLDPLTAMQVCCSFTISFGIIPSNSLSNPIISCDLLSFSKRWARPQTSYPREILPRPSMNSALQFIRPRSTSAYSSQSSSAFTVKWKASGQPESVHYSMCAFASTHI